MINHDDHIQRGERGTDRHIQMVASRRSKGEESIAALSFLLFFFFLSSPLYLVSLMQTATGTARAAGPAINCLPSLPHLEGGGGINSYACEVNHPFVMYIYIVLEEV